jgi:shikimate kinase
VQRPLVAGKSADELRAYIADTLGRRLPYYTRATYIFCANMLENAEQVGQSVSRFRADILHL